METSSDHIIPAEECNIDTEQEIDPKDVENSERLLDDTFEDVEIVAKKEKEIDELRKQNLEQENRIEMLENKVADSEKKKANPPSSCRLPKQWQHIRFQVDGNEDPMVGKVMKKHKNKSTHRNIIGIRFDDGTEREFDFSKPGVYWQDVKDDAEYQTEVCCLHSVAEESDLAHETFATVLTKSEIKGRKDAKPAMQEEIEKFKRFGAFKKVIDEGQYSIKTRWVFTEADDDTKGYLLKARLCMRGDRELDAGNIRSDSPTAHKDSLKLALSIAANENFQIISADIKSAFLQGKSLNRKVYVTPPPEANDEGYLWLLEKAAYGLVDGSRLFYLELKNRLEHLGMKELSGDPGLFTMHEGGRLIGIVCCHVDDLLMAGNENFFSNVVEKLFKIFKFSKVEKKKFKYVGCEIEKLNNGDIALNQNEYIEKIKEVDIPPRRIHAK